MAATLQQLAARTLQKLGVVAAQEAPSSADEQKAIEKLEAAMGDLDDEGLLRFTRHDIPRYAEEPLCMLAAALAASDFERPVDPSWGAAGMVMIARALRKNTNGTAPVAYF